MRVGCRGQAQVVRPVPQALSPAEPSRWPSATLSIFYVFFHFLCQLRTVTVHSPLRGCGKKIYLLPQRPWSGGLTTITWSSEKCHVSHKSQLQWHRTQDASWDSPSSQNRLLLSQREEVDGDLCLNMDMPRKPAHH